jgi:hypothetical protein
LPSAARFFDGLIWIRKLATTPIVYHPNFKHIDDIGGPKRGLI